ncbi:acetylglutamate kinase [Feifania hominis]|uniref:Acetylglutamate kinase n=1 Tax=Feifania hominis TaxID=2763660 RepID=A0A926HV19_9FIRM|nr:acetylglutamate kinase [Feifania hominis]MBC8536883.1 acetylglutamate kinase [Feifania hominis]
MEDSYNKAGVLVQALPYIQRYTNKTIVVKYGGNAMVSGELKDAVISDIVLLSLVGIHVVLVHGGGPEISQMLDKIGKQSRFVNGLRYTDAETMDIVQMVLSGKVNKDLVSLIQKKGGSAVGLCGLDGSLIQAKKLEEPGVDYGYVGEITDVNIAPIVDALEDGYIPVVATVAEGVDDDCCYNINADTAAAKIAEALGALKVVLLTDVRGVLRDAADEASLISVIRAGEVDLLKRDGVIKGGMIPKIDCCVNALRGGVGRAYIIDGRVPHSILVEMLTDEGIGTMIVGDKDALK